MTEKRFVKELVEYAKGNKEWENIIDEDGTDGYKITEDGRLVVIHEEDADHYTAKLSIDSMNFELCGMTALERKIDVILRFFYTEVTKEMIKEYMNNINENGGNEMSEELKNLLEVVSQGNNDLLQETIDAAKIILAGGYEGHKEDLEYLEDVKTGFELEELLSQGDWYWQDELRMERLIEKAAILIEKEIEENLFIEDSPIIGPECRYLDCLAEKLATFEIVGDDIYERDDKYEVYSTHEQEILGLADELLERIEAEIMQKYNFYQSRDFFWKFYYKIDKKFDTLEECLDYFDILI